MKSKALKRAYAALLSIMLIIGLLPTAVFAAENKPTSLVVGNVTVNVEEKGYWTTDENGVLSSSDASNYNVYYDANGTLYLNNATIAGVNSTSYGAGILYKGGDLTIDLKGNNKITASADSSDSAGIFNSYNFAYGLTLLGGGSLDIKSADTHDTTYAIFIGKNITIDNVNITATTGKTEVSRNEAIRSEAGSIYIKNSTVNVQTPDNENAWWSRGLMAGNGRDGISVTIENSVVTVNAGNVKTDTTGEADSNAIEANEINIKNSFVVANGQHLSLAPYKEYTIDDSLVHLIIRDDGSDESYVYGNYELSSNYTVDKDETLQVDVGAVLTVGKDRTLTNEGNIINKGNIQINIGGSYIGSQPGTNKVKYEIGWDTDGDSTANENGFYEYGTPLIYDGQTPEKQEDAQYSYEFSGWNPSIADGATVNESAMYSAVFTTILKSFTIIVPDGDGYEISYMGQTNIPYNGTFSFTINFEKGYYPGEDFAVKVNGTEIQRDSKGTYSITGITENKQITVEGIEYNYVPPTPVYIYYDITASAGEGGTITPDGNSRVLKGTDKTFTITPDSDYVVSDVLVDGKSVGAVTSYTFETVREDHSIQVLFELSEEAQEAIRNEKLKKGVESTTIRLRSTLGNGFIRLDWEKSAGYKVDYYEVYKSTKRYSGYGTEPYFETKQGGLTGWYKNTKELKKGTRYYYKVRGIREIAGETVYTKWSTKAWRLVK